MKSIRTFPIITLLTLLFVVASPKLSDWDRYPASSLDEEITQVFRLFNHPAMPKKVTIFQNRVTPLIQGKITIPSYSDTVCWFNGAENKLGSAKTFEVAAYKANNLECQYNGKNRNIDIEVTFIATPSGMGWDEVNNNKKAALEKQVETINNISKALTQRQHGQKLLKVFQNAPTEVYQNKKFIIPANKHFVQLFEVNKNDYIEILEIGGVAAPTYVKYQTSPYTPQGETDFISETLNPHLAIPKEKPYALVCGFQKNGEKRFQRILLRGWIPSNPTFYSKRFNGQFSCTFNGDINKFSEYSGEYYIQLKILKYEKGLEWLTAKQLKLAQEIKQEIDLKETLIQEKNQKAFEALDEVVSNVTSMNQALIEIEPPPICDLEKEAIKYDLNSTAFHATTVYKYTNQLHRAGDPKAGNFCSRPTVVNEETILSICDNPKSFENGITFFLNSSTLKPINNIVLDMTNGMESQAAIIKSQEGKVKAIVINSNSGAHFLSPQGELINSIKTEHSLFQAPLVTPNGTVVLLTNSSSSNEVFFIKNYEVDKKDSIPGSGSFFDPFFHDGKVFIGSNIGHLYVYSQNGEFLKDITVNGAYADYYKSLYTPAVNKQGEIFLGDSMGHLYKISKDLNKVKRIYSAPDLTDEKSIYRRKVIGAPAILKNGDIAIITRNNYMHLISPQGELRYMVDLQRTFRNIDIGPVIVLDDEGNELIWVAKHTKIQVYNIDGTLKAFYKIKDAGAEQFAQPINLGNGIYISGMHNGVRKFSMKKTDKTITTKLKAYCPNVTP